MLKLLERIVKGVCEIWERLAKTSLVVCQKGNNIIKIVDFRGLDKCLRPSTKKCCLLESEKKRGNGEHVQGCEIHVRGC